jgi:thiol:disulfide interchange protein
MFCLSYGLFGYGLELSCVMIWVLSWCLAVPYACLDYVGCLVMVWSWGLELGVQFGHDLVWSYACLVMVMFGYSLESS